MASIILLVLYKNYWIFVKLYVLGSNGNIHNPPVKIKALFTIFDGIHNGPFNNITVCLNMNWARIGAILISFVCFSKCEIFVRSKRPSYDFRLPQKWSLVPKICIVRVHFFDPQRKILNNRDYFCL